MAYRSPCDCGRTARTGFSSFFKLQPSSFLPPPAGPTIRLRRWARKTGLSLITPNPPRALRPLRSRAVATPHRFPGQRLPLRRPPLFLPVKTARRHSFPRSWSLHRPPRRSSPPRHSPTLNCRLRRPRPPRPSRLQHLRRSHLRSQLRHPPRNRRPRRLPWCKPLRPGSQPPRLRPSNHQLPQPRRPFRKALHQPPRRT